MSQINPALPSLDDLIATSDYATCMGVGLNEIIVAAGFHPAEYGRNSLRSFGGEYPRYGSEEWAEFIAPHIQVLEYKKTRAA